MKRFDIDYKSWETDISGACNVEYVVNGASGTSFLIQKRKDITSCINRYKTNSILQTTPYDFRKQYSVLPVLQSTSHCDVNTHARKNHMLFDSRVLMNLISCF